MYVCFRRYQFVCTLSYIFIQTLGPASVENNRYKFWHIPFSVSYGFLHTTIGWFTRQRERRWYEYNKKDALYCSTAAHARHSPKLIHKNGTKTDKYIKTFMIHSTSFFFRFIFCTNLLRLRSQSCTFIRFDLESDFLGDKNYALHLFIFSRDSSRVQNKNEREFWFFFRFFFFVLSNPAEFSSFSQQQSLLILFDLLLFFLFTTCLSFEGAMKTDCYPRIESASEHRAIRKIKH